MAALLKAELAIFLDRRKCLLVAKIVDLEGHVGRRMKLRDLHVFFAVVQTGSLAKAAAQFRVSQPAVSQLIRDMEKSLGVKLFDRTSRGVEPTVYGRALLARGRAAFDELKQGIRDIQFLSEPTSGEIRLGCPEAIAVILPSVVESFSRQYPSVVLDVLDEEFDRSAMKLRDRNLDFILQRLRGRPTSSDGFFDDLNVEVLFDDELVVAVSRQSRWAGRRRVGLADLVDEPWILASADSWNYRIVSEAFEAQGLPMPKVVLRTFSTHLRVNMVASGHFIATFPKSVIDYYAGRFGLKVLQVDIPTKPWPVAVLTLKARTLSPVVHFFIDHVRAALVPNGTRPRSRMR
jgi:DNA-binding transcriptional LysR family regulator